MMTINKIYKDIIAFHPGSYVEDIIEGLNITQQEFAQRIGTTPKTISKILNGEENISIDLANKLDKISGISLETWMNLQASYDKKIIEIEESMNDDEDNICKSIDFSYLKRFGFIEDKKYDAKGKKTVLRKLLNYASLVSLSEFRTNISYRTTKNYDERSVVNSNIMLELATNIARNKTNNKYDKRKLESRLKYLKQMTFEKPEVFLPKLKELLLECGIVLVHLPNLKNANLNGAVKRFKNGSVLLLITDRNKRADIFWFSLLHELGHIYYSDFNYELKTKEEYFEREERADIFAQDFFIPKKEYYNFVINKNFSSTNIGSFASECEIDPILVIGRLQHDKYLPYSYKSEFIKMYNFDELNSF